MSAVATEMRKLSREELRSLTEIERQNYYTDQLDDETYKYPLFSGKQAVLSQRRSGYRTSAKAAREIVDNGLEAGANNIWVIFDRPDGGTRGKFERVNKVSGIAFIDDGPGMTPKMARYALTWGGGTHYEDPVKIGRFGFGLPNSSINQCKRVEVYTRTNAEQPWVMAALDINDLPDHGLAGVDPLVEAELPDFVQQYLKKKKIDLQTGTVVVWVQPDRLTYSQASSLKEHLLDDFGTTYRYLLPRQEKDADGRKKILSEGVFKLFVEDVAVEAVDPLFLTPGCRLHLPPDDKEPKKGGAWCSFERLVAVKYFIDPDSGAKRMERLKTPDEIDAAKNDATVLAVGTISIRIARFPYGFVLGEKQHRATKEHGASEGGKRFEIRQSRRGVGFVRAGREIETFDAYPRTKRDKESGLGDWPHVSGYAYHYGVEVQIDPDLDEVFNIGNDKQTIRPIDDFWRVMHEIGLDEAVREEERYQAKLRKEEKAARHDPQITSEEATAAAVTAVAQAAAATGKTGALPENRREESKQRQEKAIQDVVNKTGESIEKARKAVEEEAARKKYVLEFFEAKGGVFYEPGLGNGLQHVVRINKLHPFYETFYSRVAAMNDPIARQAIIVLLMTLAEAEIMAPDSALHGFYVTQRESVWSPFLKLGLQRLEELQPEPEDLDDINGTEE